MTPKLGPIETMVHAAIDGGFALTKERIAELRAKSEKAISALKSIFWIAIVLFNLMVWDPFALPIPESLRWAFGLGALLVAVVFPIFGIRRHRSCLYQLEDADQGPKRRKSDESGRQYMDRVKKQGRFFVRAEFDALQRETVPGR